MSGRDRLHRLVWLNQSDELASALRSSSSSEEGDDSTNNDRSNDNNSSNSHHHHADDGDDVNALDVRGNTALHLACMLGHVECARLLLQHGASTRIRNSEGWLPLHEARGCGNRDILTSLIVSARRQFAAYFYERGPKFVQQLNELDDFYLEMNWDFSSWVPLLSRLCPSDTYRIWKKGACLRVDTTLVGFESLKWIRGHVSFLFLPDRDDKGRVGSFVIVDQVKGIYETLTEDADPVKTEEYVNMLMNTPIRAGRMIGMDKVSFSPHKGGILGLGAKSEIVGEYTSEVYAISGLKFKTMTRTEHLISSDAKPDDIVDFLAEEHKQEEIEDKVMSLTLGKSESDVDKFIKDTKEKTLRFRPSLPPPKTTVSFEDYFYPELSNNQPSSPNQPYSSRGSGSGSSFASFVGLETKTETSSILEVGRPRKQKESVRSFKASIWMSNSFPLFVEQLLPIFEIMAPSNEHFGALKEFIDMKLPRGFPVKIEIPLFGIFAACVTFQNYRVDHHIDASLFKVDPNFAKGEVKFGSDQN